MNKQTEESKQILPTAITYNQTLPNIKSVVEKQWHIFHIKSKFKKRFRESPITTYRRNTNLKQIIGSNNKRVKFGTKNCGKRAP